MKTAKKIIIKVFKKYYYIFLWIILIFIFRDKISPFLDFEKIERYASFNQGYLFIIFILLWIVRIIFFIPGATFMVLGGLLFTSITSFLLSLLGIALSETLIFILAKVLFKTEFKNLVNKKYPDIEKLIQKYNYKFLALGMICPIAPSDAICFLSATAGLKYTKYIITVVISNIPVIFTYSFVGIKFMDSKYGIIITLATIIITSILVIRIWNKLKRKIIE